MSHGGPEHVVKLIVRTLQKDEPNPEQWAYVESGDAKGKAIYQYQFVPPYGAVHMKVGPPGIVRVRLEADAGITLHDLRIETDPHHQLRVDRETCGPLEFVIHDENDAIQVAYYSILVKAGNTVLTCDPMIYNRP